MTIDNTTEFTCEVVEIIDVYPHPNADRLDIARFKTLGGGPANYTVVHGKGQLSVGQLMVYVSVDAVVPLTGPQGERWQFLRERQGVKPTDISYRIRAARLRGVYSEGILVNPGTEEVHYGQKMDKLWDIVPYVRPEEKTTSGFGWAGGRTAPAISTELFPVYTTTSLAKCPHGIPKDTPVFLTEKLHGTNARFGYIPVGKLVGGQRFVVGSHRAIRSVETNWLDRLVKRIQCLFKDKRYVTPEPDQSVWSYVAHSLNLKDKLRKYPNLVIYGEIYGYTHTGARIQALTYGAIAPQLRVFAMYDVTAKCWLPFEQVMDICSDLDLLHVYSYGQLPWNEEAQELVKTLAEQASPISSTQICEGIVIHGPTGPYKYVSQQFRLAGH